jgi:hypothetical protein
MQTCEEIEVKSEDQLVECRKASRECASNGIWAHKGRFDVKVKSLHSIIASAGLDVSDAQAIVLSLEQSKSRLEVLLTSKRQLHAPSCVERERLLLESLKVVLANPFPLYPIQELVSQLHIASSPTCVVFLRAFIGRCPIVASCACFLHPYCMWQLMGHPKKDVPHVCLDCGKRVHGAWAAQWGLKLHSDI